MGTCEQSWRGHERIDELECLTMARKRVWIVAPFTTLPGEPGFNRFTYLAEKMSDRMDVTLWTSRFSHHLKKVRRLNAFWGTHGTTKKASGHTS